LAFCIASILSVTLGPEDDEGDVEPGHAMKAGPSSRIAVRQQATMVDFLMVLLIF
jgi:hypothetical protein